MKYERILCEKCGYEIGKNNYSRHYKVCNGQKPQIGGKHTSTITRTDTVCNYCSKKFTSINAVVQHEIRCPKNPDRRAFNNLAGYSGSTRKGKNKYNDETIAKQCETMRKKYENGFVSPMRGKKICFDYIYEDHNNSEISKWINYVNSKNVDIPEYSTRSFGYFENSYTVISKRYTKEGNTISPEFEHNYIANLYLNGSLEKKNTVHHLDKNTKNNDIHNLIVFETTDEHKTFHNSKYAWLIYNENTHKFNCILKKDIRAV